MTDNENTGRDQTARALALPFSLSFGGVDYEVKVRPWRDAEAWNRKCRTEFLDPYVRAMNGDDDPGIQDFLGGDWIGVARNLLEQYAPDLPWDEIDAAAVPKEFEDAIDTVRSVTNPLLAIAGTLALQRQMATVSESVRAELQKRMNGRSEPLSSPT